MNANESTSISSNVAEDKSDVLEEKCVESAGNECMIIHDIAESNNKNKKASPVVCEISSDESSSESVLESTVSSPKVEKSDENDDKINGIRANCSKFCDHCKSISPSVASNLCQSCKVPFAFQCKICDKRFDSYSKCVYHLDSYCDPKQIYKCTYCDYTNSKVAKIKRHMESVHRDGRPSKLIECDLCLKGFVSNRSLMSHKRFHHEARPVDAGIPVLLVSLAELSQLEGDLDEEPAVKTPCNLFDKFDRYCPECCESTKNKVGSVKKKSCCQVCDTQLLLRCVRCGKLAKSYNLMQSHLQKACQPNNEAQGYFKCSDCDYFTGIRANLKVHLQNKHKIEGKASYYECDRCSYASAVKHNLKIHVKNAHHGDDGGLHECSRCEKAFTRVKLFNRHMKYCGEEPKFKCVYCDYKAKYRKCLETHWSKAHPDLIASEPKRSLLTHLKD